MNIVRGFLLGLVLCCAASVAVAAEALVGHYVDHTGSAIKVSLLSNGKGRIDLGPEAYFLLDGDKIWVVSKYMDDDWTKADFVARTKQALLETPGILQKYTHVGVIDTGYTTEVAGYEGKSFEVTVAGTGEKYMLVLSDDKDVARLSKAIMIIFQDLNQEPGRRDVVEQINASLKADYGVLNLDRELTLQKIERQEYEPAYFELPAAFKK